MNASGRNRIVVDWDDTCIDSMWPDMGDWKPGSIEALRTFLSLGFDVAVFSTRLAPTEVDEVTPRPEAQRAEIGRVRAKLDTAGLKDVSIWLRPWKPGALAYIDDKAVHYNGRKGAWAAIVDKVCVMTGRMPKLPEEVE